MGFCDHGSFYFGWNWYDSNAAVGKLFKRTNGVDKMTPKDEVILEAKKQIGRSLVDVLQRESGLRFRVSFKEPDNCTQVIDVGVPFLDIYVIGEVFVNEEPITCFYIKF